MRKRYRVPESLRPVIPLTVSCDRPQRKPGRRLQCGSCSSCLLRHLALIASGVGDKTEYDSYPVQQSIPRKSHYWAMNQQVETMRPFLDNWDAWSRLALEYPDTLPDLANYLSRWSGSDLPSIQKLIIGLYQRHISEWEYLLSRSKPTMLAREYLNSPRVVAHR